MCLKIMMHPLQPEKPQTLEERQTCVVEDVTEEIEKILSRHLPDCQGEVVEKLIARLPQRLTDEEVEEATNTALSEFGDTIVASGMSWGEQLAYLKKAKADFIEANRGRNAR